MANPAATSLEGNMRFYRWWKTGRKYPSVTTILKTLPKEALIYWAARVVAEYSVANLDMLKGLKPADAISIAKKTPWAERDSAADIGSAVHACIECYLRGEAVLLPETINNFPINKKQIKSINSCLEQFKRFEDIWQPEFEFVETTVYSDRFDYAGTLDSGMKLKVPEVYRERIATLFGADKPSLRLMGDVKTGKGVYADTALQLAAYTYADFIGKDGEEAQPIPDMDGAVVLHVRPTFCRVYPMNIHDQVFEYFLNFRKSWNWMTKDSLEVMGPICKAPDDLLGWMGA